MWTCRARHQGNRDPLSVFSFSSGIILIIVWIFPTIFLIIYSQIFLSWMFFLFQVNHNEKSNNQNVGGWRLKCWPEVLFFHSAFLKQRQSSLFYSQWVSEWHQPPFTLLHSLENIWNCQLMWGPVVSTHFKVHTCISTLRCDLWPQYSRALGSLETISLDLHQLFVQMEHSSGPKNGTSWLYLWEAVTRVRNGWRMSLWGR